MTQYIVKSTFRLEEFRENEEAVCFVKKVLFVPNVGILAGTSTDLIYMLDEETLQKRNFLNSKEIERES